MPADSPRGIYRERNADEGERERRHSGLYFSRSRVLAVRKELEGKNYYGVKEKGDSDKRTCEGGDSPTSFGRTFALVTVTSPERFVRLNQSIHGMGKNPARSMGKSEFIAYPSLISTQIVMHMFC